MSYLLYAIFQTPSDGKVPALPSGIGDQSLILVTREDDTGGKLTAVVSAYEPSRTNQDIDNALLFGRVIQTLHDMATVIPMRYGCLFQDCAALERHLEDHCREYLTVLAELDGHVEMSVRILVPQQQAASKRPKSCEPSPHGVGETEEKTAGLAYLQTLRRQYQSEENVRLSVAETTDRLNGQLRGLYSRNRFEAGALAGQSMPTLHYLVPKESVGAFRNVFRDISSSVARHRLLLSGPWPPYNFVTSALVAGEGDEETLGAGDFKPPWSEVGPR